jgi:hypothetical protein
MVAVARPLRLFVVVLFLLLAGLPISMPASGSDAAKTCQKGGYLVLVRDDGTSFRNTGECVKYLASGDTAVPLAIRIDPIPGNEDIYCGYEIYLVNFPIGSYDIEKEDEAHGPTASHVTITEPLTERFAGAADAIDPIGPTLDVAITVTNTETGLRLSETAAIPCREP